MKLKFWEKDNDPFDLPPLDDSPSDLGMPKDVPQMQAPSDFNPHGQMPQGMALEPASPQMQQESHVHEQLIVAKLEAVMSKLETITHRLDNIEARLSQPPPQQGQVKQQGPWYR